MPINLEEHEIAIILDALSTRPYMEVAALIRKIVDQQAEQAPSERVVLHHTTE